MFTKTTKFILFPRAEKYAKSFEKISGKRGTLIVPGKITENKCVKKEIKYVYMFHVCMGYMFSGGKYCHLSFSESRGIPSRLREHRGGNVKRVRA